MRYESSFRNYLSKNNTPKDRKKLSPNSSDSGEEEITLRTVSVSRIYYIIIIFNLILFIYFNSS